MNKIKDFIYDKSDIVIALLILVVAAGVITWRMGIVLEYPKVLSGNSDSDVIAVEDNDTKAPDASTVGNESQDSKDNKDSQGTADSKDNKDTKEPDKQTETPDAGATDSQLPMWKDGVLTRDVEVDVEGNTASAAIQCLVEAGLFDDYAEYQKLCQKAGLDHEKVKAGAFTFEKGSTKAKIARAMNWG